MTRAACVTLRFADAFLRFADATVARSSGDTRKEGRVYKKNPSALDVLAAKSSGAATFVESADVEFDLGLLGLETGIVDSALNVIRGNASRRDDGALRREIDTRLFKARKGEAVMIQLTCKGNEISFDLDEVAKSIRVTATRKGFDSPAHCASTPAGFHLAGPPECKRRLSP